MNVISLPFEYRPYQLAAVDNCLDAIKRVQHVGLILPTGGGKTEVFIETCNRFIRDNPNRSVLILSHLSILTRQTSNRFRQRAPHLKLGVLQAGERPDVDCNIIISTMQSASIEKKANWQKMQCNYPVGLIIIDECHFMTCDSYEKALSFYADVPVIGCTATPFKASALMTHYFDEIAFSLSLQELIDMGFLVAPKLFEITRAGNIVEEVIAQVMAIYQEKEKGNKAIFFMQTIEDAKALATAFIGVGVNARAVTSELVGEYRDSILGGFNDGDIDVLTTVNVLTAGFDAPKVEAIFMPYATQSATQYLQRIGRGLRTAAGKTECRIYVFGSSPSVSRKLYDKLQARVLRANGKNGEFDTYRDDMEYNDFDRSSEVYHWTAKVLNSITKLEKIGLGEVAQMLNEKRFPPKFLTKIDKFMNRVPKSKIKRRCVTAMTEKQFEILDKEGFTGISNLSRYEANCLIAALFNPSLAAATDEKYVLKSGRFAGRHLDEMSPKYIQLLLWKYPASAIANTIREWQYERSGSASGHDQTQLRASQ